MSVRTIKVNKKIAEGIDWVLGEGSTFIADDLIETGLTDFDWTSDQVTELGHAIDEISYCLRNEKHFKVTISKK